MEFDMWQTELETIRVFLLNPFFVFQMNCIWTSCIIYSNKKETSDFHGTVSFDPAKMLQQNKTKMLIKRPTHEKMVII